METTLTDRYIHAVTRTLPESQRGDVATELRASIIDQVEARVEGGEDAETVERAVLTALGDPDKLAAGYADRPLWLIGPRFYLVWRRLLKLLLWIVIPVAAFALALGQTLAGAGIGEIIGTTIGVTISVGVHLVFWTTLVFAVIERSDDARDAVPSEWTLDQLPAENPATGARFVDLVASIVFLVAAAAAVVWDQLVGLAYLRGSWISFLSPELWPWWIGGLLAVMAVEAVLQIVVYLNGRWTTPLAAFNALINLVAAGVAIGLLSQQRLLNPGFWTTVIPEQDAANVFGILSIITGFGVVGVAVWDSLDAFLKARRARR